MAKLLAEVGSATLVEGWKGHCTSLAGLSAYLARLPLTLQTTCREGVWPRQGGRRGRARALRMIYPAARGCSTELWIGVQGGTPPVPPASGWYETAVADQLGVPLGADLDRPCRFLHYS